MTESDQNANVMIITIMLPIKPINASLLFLVHPFFTDMLPICLSLILCEIKLWSAEILLIVMYLCLILRQTRINFI